MRFYAVITRLLYFGEHPPGSLVEMPDEDVGELVALGALEPVDASGSDDASEFEPALPSTPPPETEPAAPPPPKPARRRNAKPKTTETKA